jgi:hypothetical protein
MRLLAFRSLVLENCRWRIEELTIAEFLELLEARKMLVIGFMPMIGFCRWVENLRESGLSMGRISARVFAPLAYLPS